MTNALTVILSDSQFGSEDRKLHRNLVTMVADMQPDALVHIGDLLDCKAPARWSKGTADEFALTLQKEIDRAHAWLSDLRRVYDGPFHIRAGNHDERIETYLRTKAPALQSLRALDIVSLLGLRDLGIQWEPRPFALRTAPGWVFAHGHEGRASLIPGGTALALAKQFGKSVVCGHTHKLGLAHDTRGYNGGQDTLWGMEIGHAMDIRQASYLTSGSANWQQGFGTLERVGRRVFPRPYPIIGGDY